MYLIITITAPFAQFFARGLVVKGDAAATATNILAHESLYRLGGAADLISVACDAALALLFYELLKPVSRSLSLLAAFFRLTHVAILAVSTLNHFIPLLLLGSVPYLSVFSVEQLQAWSLLALSFHGEGYNIALVFFGFTCVLLGYLIFKSKFLPRTLGVLMAVAGSCYLTNSFMVLLFPAFADHLFPWILLAAGPGEIGLMLWLLVKGVDVGRWTEQASAAAQWPPPPPHL